MDVIRLCPSCLAHLPRYPVPNLRTLAATRRAASTAAFTRLQTREPRNNGSRRAQYPRIDRRGHATASPPPENVAVLGGGITGLTTAYYLSKFLPETSKITLYEANDRLGGWIHTIKKDAPDGQPVYFENGPRMLRGLGRTAFRADDYVCYDMLSDLKLQLKVSPPRNKLFCYHDRLVQVPPSPKPLSLLEDAWQLASGTHVLSGMPKAALAYRRLGMRQFPDDAVNHDVSIGDWLRMTFGDIPGPRNVLSAMMHGIYGGNIDKLSLACVLPAFWYGTHMRAGPDEALIPRQDYELLRELDPRKKGIEEDVKSWSLAEVLSFPEGMSTIIHGIREALGRHSNVTIRTSTPVSEIKYLEDRDKVKLSTPSTESALHDKVISTTPSSALTSILPADYNIPLNDEAVSIMTVSFFFPQEDLTRRHNGFGYLIPITSPNPEQVLGVFFDSDTYGMHPDEKRGTKLTVLMGGHFWSHLPSVPSKDECVVRASEVLRRHLGIAQEPELVHVNLAAGCIPQHTVGHRETLARAHPALQRAFNGRLAVAGGSYTPVGVMPAMRAGYDAARSASSGDGMGHVGDTGLAQFETGLDILRVPREELNALGKTLRGSGAVGRWFSGR